MPLMIAGFITLRVQQNKRVLNLINQNHWYHIIATDKFVSIKPIQSQMSLVVSDIVLKNKFAIKRYEIVLYTCNI